MRNRDRAPYVMFFGVGPFGPWAGGGGGPVAPVAGPWALSVPFSGRAARSRIPFPVQSRRGLLVASGLRLSVLASLLRLPVVTVIVVGGFALQSLLSCAKGSPFSNCS